MKSRHSYLYSLVFAAVNFAEALILLCTLGIWGPTWTMQLAKWHTLRNIRRIKLAVGISNTSSTVCDILRRRFTN
jgi:hypothetical protein